MITRLLLLLIVYETTCDEVPATKTTLLPSISAKCKYIKCSAKEDPKCVKMKNERSGNSIYIIVFNKCEIQYVKCVNGFDAKFVKMKYCEHRNLTMKVTSNNTNNYGKRRSQTLSKGHARVKREMRKQRLVYKSSKTDRLESPKKIDEDYNSYEDEGGYKVKLNEVIEYYDSDDLEASRPQKLIGPALVRPREALQGSGTGDRPLILVGEAPPHSVHKPIQPPPADKLHGYNNPDYETINEDLFPLFSKETLDEHAKNQHAAPVDGNTEQCPNSCPNRVQMVCGKCQHGIYKTFKSSCHMRMFSCQYSAEIMELVSRHPCILSAPFIAQAGEMASTKEAINVERDQVLSFIKCRNLGLLKTGDPRCPF